MATVLIKQITCVQKELEFRKRVYPQWVSAGKLSASKAEQEISAMRDVLRTLVDLAGSKGERVKESA